MADCILTCDPSNQEVSSNCVDPSLQIPTLPSNITAPEMPTAKTITEEKVDGNGVFDVYMRAGMAQLDVQYKENRIKGSDYASAYVQMVQLMMTEANKFVIGKVQAEIAAKLFDQQWMGAAYDALAKEAQAKKLMADREMVCQQTAELKANGGAERVLKDAQSKVQKKQADLYDQQIKSFKEKTNIDAAKVIYDTWAVQAVEEPDSTWQVTKFKESTSDFKSASQRMLDLAKKTT